VTDLISKLPSHSVEIVVRLIRLKIRKAGIKKPTSAWVAIHSSFERRKMREQEG